MTPARRGGGGVGAGFSPVIRAGRNRDRDVRAPSVRPYNPVAAAIAIGAYFWATVAVVKLGVSCSAGMRKDASSGDCSGV